MERAIIIRRAKPEEAEELSALSMRSKAYWDYDPEFLEACRAALTVTENKIFQYHVYVAEDDDTIAGFYCLIANGGTGILDDLFIDPPFIGKGCGRLLWDDMVKLANELGIREISIDADPNAEEFYKKMGAVRIGDVASSVLKGRRLPLMKLVLREEGNEGT